MNDSTYPIRLCGLRGFTLPAVLVIVGALLILVVGLLAVTGMERRTARSYVEFQRADMATRAGLEEVKGILNKHTANDDFLVVSQTPPLPLDGDRNREAASYLYIARGESTAGVKFSYHPLFSTVRTPSVQNMDITDVPDARDFIGDDPKKIETLPYLNDAEVAWVPIKGARNGKEQTVARYAYWIEDLQGRINPKVAGNERGAGNTHARNEWPFPAPGMNPEPLDEKNPALDGIAVHVLDGKASEVPEGDIVRRVIDGRKLMVSPRSVLGATGFAAPVERNEQGLPVDATAAALEKNTFPVLQAYEERPMIPYTPGIDPEMAGQPKLNLNKLLNENRRSAINDFASHIRKALPNFERRQGGFIGGLGADGRNVIPDDYLNTLAANAFDYADVDNDPTVEIGSYRGLDGYPLMSELLLKIDYLGYRVISNRLNLQFRFILQAEFWNMTNQPVAGNARLSYEVGLPLEAIGAGVRGKPFDDPVLLKDKAKTSHDLVEENGKFVTKLVPVTLRPDEYKFYTFATVNYLMDVGPNNISYNTPVTMVELFSDEPRGISFRWNDVQVERIEKIVRDPEGVKFTILYPEETGKAAIPGHSYGPYGSFVNNMGDPRMSHYFRNQRLGENSYPRNMSPNRRNIRRGTIYDGNQSAHYGRVLPSEWPDGGHDSPYGTLAIITDKTTQMSHAKYAYTLAPSPYNAPQRISNAGFFRSPTELGHIYDPIMWTYAYDDYKGNSGSGTTDTNQLVQGYMPARRNVYPDVTIASIPSMDIGGGNTLRVGRYEHRRFDEESEGMRAAYLLDLFHAGKGTSEKDDEREGNLIDINGQVNINTASKDTIRALAAGVLKQDNELREVTNWTHQLSNGRMAPASKTIEIGTPTKDTTADIIADAIILRRPFSAMGQLSAVKDGQDRPVFGNKELYEQGIKLNWSDAAAEEVFARVHDASTFRSRNFRVWVIGQSLTGSESNPEVMAETRKVYTVFADPGERTTDGAIKAENMRTRVMYESDF